MRGAHEKLSLPLLNSTQRFVFRKFVRIYLHNYASLARLTLIDEGYCVESTHRLCWRCTVSSGFGPSRCHGRNLCRCASCPVESWRKSRRFHSRTGRCPVEHFHKATLSPRCSRSGTEAETNAVARSDKILLFLGNHDLAVVSRELYFSRR